MIASQRPVFPLGKQVNSRASGFTLLEMLVVLMLVSLITTLLFQGFSYVLVLRSQFVNQLDDLHRGALQEHWFRTTTAALMPGPEDSEAVFKGDDLGFSGLTIAALHENAGIPARIQWRLFSANNETELRYYPVREESDYWLVMAWFGERGGFRYLSAEGTWYEQWPPAGIGENSTEQLPQAILFMGKRRLDVLTWVVSIRGRKGPIPDLFKMLDI